MNIENHCKKCETRNHCCIFEKNSGFTFVSVKDAKRIKKRINKEYSYFLDYSPLSKKIVNYLKQEDPSLEGNLRYLQLDQQNRILRLKTKKDGKCIFLNDQNRCEIYGIRPNICKIFPFWAIKLNSGKIKIISHDVEPKCTFVISQDTDKILTDNEKNEIKKTFKKIRNESKNYKKNIKGFVKKIKFE